MMMMMILKMMIMMAMMVMMISAAYESQISITSLRMIFSKKSLQRSED